MKNLFECSIIVATYNRSTLLNETLNSLASHLDSAKHRNTEVIIINNNSTDETLSTANEFKSKIRNLNILLEEKQGLSHARNAGINNATGEFVIFIDDDIEIETGWLDSILTEFEKMDVAVVGGKVLPFGNRVFPDWLPREYAYLLSIFDPSDSVRDFHTAMGANFAVRRSVFEAIGKFNPALGRRGSKLLGGEEVELFRRILSSGSRIIYTPNAIVYHKIDNKIKKDYITDYAYWLGVSEAHIDRDIISKSKFYLKYLRSLIFPYTVYPVIKIFFKANIREVKYTIKIRYAKGYINYKSALVD